MYVVYRSETYGHVYRINILHMVIIGVTCPEATKVNPLLYNLVQWLIAQRN